jgi:hypothetical protein
MQRHDLPALTHSIHPLDDAASHRTIEAARCEPLLDLVAALIAGLTFVALLSPASASTALVAGLTLIALLSRRLVGERRTCRGQREAHSQQESCSLPLHHPPSRRAAGCRKHPPARSAESSTKLGSALLLHPDAATLSHILTERFIGDVRGDDPALASYLRIEEGELEAGGLN